MFKDLYITKFFGKLKDNWKIIAIVIAVVGVVAILLSGILGVM